MNTSRAWSIVRNAPQATLALAVMLVPAAAGAATWSFTPRVAVGQSWTDNVRLAADGQEESEWITEVKPGFLLGLDGRRIEARLDYDLQALWFADNSEFDDVFHQVNATGKAELWPESLFVESFARFNQQNIDTRGRITYSNLFNTNNRTDALVFGLSPYHAGRWGNWGESLVRYNYQGVRYSNTDDTDIPPQDADTNSISATLGSQRGARGVSWRATGVYSITEFDISDEFEYAQAELELGVPIGLRSRLTGTVGQESDVGADPTKGGLDSTYWYLGYAWSRSELESFEFKVGERYFGTSWEASWRRRGSRGELSLDYTEQPTTSAGVLGDDGVFVPGMRPGGITSLDTRVFVRKRLASTATYRLPRSTITARVYADRREYQEDLQSDATSTEKNLGATLGYEWNLAARTRFNASVDWERMDYQPSRQDDLGSFSLSLSRDFTRTVTGVARASHYLRNSDAADGYRANLVSLFIEGRF